MEISIIKFSRNPYWIMVTLIGTMTAITKQN